MPMSCSTARVFFNASSGLFLENRDEEDDIQLSIDEDTPIFDIGEPESVLGVGRTLGERQARNGHTADLYGSADTAAFLDARNPGGDGAALFPVPANATGPLTSAF